MVVFVSGEDERQACGPTPEPPTAATPTPLLSVTSASISPASDSPEPRHHFFPPLLSRDGADHSSILAASTKNSRLLALHLRHLKRLGDALKLVDVEQLAVRRGHYRVAVTRRARELLMPE